MDDLTKIGHPDRDTLAMTEPYEVLQIAKRHRIATNMVYAVHKYLDSKSRAKIDAYIIRQRLAATIAPTNMLASLASVAPTGMLGTNAFLSLLNPGAGMLGSLHPPAFVKQLNGLLVEDVGDFGPGMIPSIQLGLSSMVR